MGREPVLGTFRSANLEMSLTDRALPGRGPRSRAHLVASALLVTSALAVSGNQAGEEPVESKTRPIALRIFGIDLLREPDPCVEPGLSWPCGPARIELVLAAPVFASSPNGPRRDDDASFEWTQIRERPTAELLRQVVFPLGDRPLRVDLTLPFTTELGSGRYIREGDVIRSPIQFDKELFLAWTVRGRIKLELGYTITYLSAEGPSTPSYLSHGPCGGLSLEF